jgi:hypothetical protein
LRTFLEDFVEQALQNQAYREVHVREDIRAIVIFGEASASSIAELGELALRAVGTDVVKLMTHIAPEEVVAHGAAVWARMTVEDAEHWWSCPPRVMYHDETYVQKIGQGIPMYNKLIKAGIGLAGREEL